jgi:hypothetical protein
MAVDLSTEAAAAGSSPNKFNQRERKFAEASKAYIDSDRVAGTSDGRNKQVKYAIGSVNFASNGAGPTLNTGVSIPAGARLTFVVLKVATPPDSTSQTTTLDVYVGDEYYEPGTPLVADGTLTDISTWGPDFYSPGAGALAGDLVLPAAGNLKLVASDDDLTAYDLTLIVGYF